MIGSTIWYKGFRHSKLQRILNFHDLFKSCDSFAGCAELALWCSSIEQCPRTNGAKHCLVNSLVHFKKSSHDGIVGHPSVLAELDAEMGRGRAWAGQCEGYEVWQHTEVPQGKIQDQILQDYTRLPKTEPDWTRLIATVLDQTSLYKTVS